MTGEIRLPPAGDQPAGGGVQVDEGGAVAAAGMPEGVPGAELGALRAQVEERTADLQRISAEYSNYRRRVERDRQLVIDSAKAQVVSGLLTVLDDIERAQQHGDLSGAFKAVADKLVAGMQAYGLEPFGVTGEGFDPDVHEAVQHSTSPDFDKPTVTAVLRRGYRLGERVLRPAMVAVTDAVTDAGPVNETPETFSDAAMSRDAAWSVGGPAPSSGGSSSCGSSSGGSSGGAEPLPDN
ncbi:MAG: nucleotide exchange factor GrpE [Pseudonocardiaceae bacterium]